MLIAKESLPFIQSYVSELNDGLKKLTDGRELSRIQSIWLQFVILGMLVTNTLCWSKFSRCGLGVYDKGALSWMFRKANIAWDLLLQASIMRIVQKYGITTGTLVIDDSDHQRSKNTIQIGKVHKIKDKKTGGYFLGQNIVFLVLVSNDITIPVGFQFHEPDPAMTAWRKEEERLLKKKVAKKHRPKKPEPNPEYPTKVDIALKLIRTFSQNYPEIKIKAITADAAYGTAHFMNSCKEYYSNTQAISEIKNNQLVYFNNCYIPVSKVFENFMGSTETIILRGKEQNITYRSAKLKLKSHDGSKRYIIALKYEGENEFRYLVATDMSWRDIDIIKAYANRWLVEVFIQDWKSYEGWGQLAKQRGCEGADQGLLLSLLCDHALYFHEANLTSFQNKEPAITTGSLRDKVITESLISFVEKIVSSENPQNMLEDFSKQISQIFDLKKSEKHLRCLSN